MRPFTSEQVRGTNRGSITAFLTTLRDTVVAGKVYAWRREFTRHDEDGNPLETARDFVYSVDSRTGERVPQRLTILVVERVDLAAGQDHEGFLALTLPMVRACGEKTLVGLRDSWMSQHPRSPLVQLVWFAVGDVRDQPLFMGFTGRGGSDYTRSPSRALDEAEALTQPQMAALAGWNRQKDDARKAKAALGIQKDETLAQRMARIEKAKERIKDETDRALFRQHERVIYQRLDRAERRQSRSILDE